MKIGYKKILIIEFLFLFLLFFCNFVLKIRDNYGVLILINLFVFILNIILFGFEKDRFRFKKDVILMIIIYSIGFLIGSYVLSFFVGYLKTSYSLKFISIIKNVAPIIIIIILSELVRYCVVTKSKGFKLGIILITLIMIFVDIYYVIPDFYSNSGAIIIESICSKVLPGIFKNVFLTYLTYNIGYKGPIIYRLIFEATDYVLPIFPGFGNYIQSILDVIFPMFLLVLIRKNIKTNKDKVEINEKKKIFSKVIYIITLSFILIMIFLTSGLFKYYSVAVASNSMSDIINRGDVVIVEKYKQEDVKNIEIGEVLFFKYKNKFVLHRVIDKDCNDTICYFQTKGDNNLDKDPFITSQSDVVGKIVFKVSYLGWPAVYLSEL